jgi:hypothetical protein
VDPRASLDLEKRKFLPPSELEFWPLGRPASSQSLSRLLPIQGVQVKIIIFLDMFYTAGFYEEDEVSYKTG